MGLAVEYVTRDVLPQGHWWAIVERRGAWTAYVVDAVAERTARAVYLLQLKEPGDRPKGVDHPIELRPLIAARHRHLGMAEDLCGQAFGDSCGLLEVGCRIACGVQGNAGEVVRGE